MEFTELDDPIQIERYLRADAPLHLYEIGDLDPFFWPSTTWYGLTDDRGELLALALLYTSSDNVTLLAFSREAISALETLMDHVQAVLPGRFDAHLSPPLMGCFSERWRATRVTEGFKMVLADPRQLSPWDTGDVVPLRPADLLRVESFFAESYPGNWFDPRMLETGQYFGILAGDDEIGDALNCVAGVHVYSPQYRVAALGNVATRPRCRRQGLARRVTARLCQSLLAEVETVGLNVHATNHAAIDCYTSLGFTVVGPYVEVQFVQK